MKRIVLLACLVVLVASGQAMASKALQLSLTPDIALQPRGTHINGVSLNIWGENPQTSFALGFVNGFNDMSKGFALGLFNYSDSYTGIQWGAVNYTTGSFFGWQAGAVDYTVGTVQGIQTGIVNYAGQLRGVQIGLVNYAATTQTGIQIGLLNIIPHNEWFSRFPDQIAPAMVFLNWRF
jgi:hypothetical protein